MSGARYSTPAFQDPVAATAKTQLELIGGTGGRLWIYDYIVGANGTPADQPMVYDIIRVTATGTGTGVTPSPLDPADVAAAALGEEDATVEPTTTGVPLIEIAANLRATYRWVAAPNSEIIVAATAGVGIAARVLSSGYTGAAQATVMHQE